jgi:hypothetical protein
VCSVSEKNARKEAARQCNFVHFLISGRKLNVIFTILILMFYPFSPRNHEPQRKLHVTEDFVAQTMADLYISNPKAKVARR